MALRGHNPLISQLVAVPRERGWHGGGRSGVFCQEEGEMASQLSPAVAVPAQSQGTGTVSTWGSPEGGSRLWGQGAG